MLLTNVVFHLFTELKIVNRIQNPPKLKLIQIHIWHTVIYMYHETILLIPHSFHDISYFLFNSYVFNLIFIHILI